MTKTAIATREHRADQPAETSRGSAPTYWWVSQNLGRPRLLGTLFLYARSSQTFSGRWLRTCGLLLYAPIALLVSLFSRRFAIRLLHTLVSGISRDRLDALGEEYFEYVLKPRLKRTGLDELRQMQKAGRNVVLVSCGLDHVIRPLARHLGVQRVLANRLDFRDGMANGRMQRPIVPPRRIWRRLLSGSPSTPLTADALCRELRCKRLQDLEDAIVPAQRGCTRPSRPCVLFDGRHAIDRMSVRETLKDKHILVAGVTGFIGKVWLAHILSDLPEVGRLYVLIRRNRTRSAVQRFEHMVSESPVFAPLHERHGDGIGEFIARRVEIIEGDVSRPDLGMGAELAARLRARLDVFINSTGLTDFNPDLREALAANVDATKNVLEFARSCDHAALMHLSTCYVAGQRDGRVNEDLVPNYNPRGLEFDAEKQCEELLAYIRKIEERADTPEMADAFRREAIEHLKDKPLAEAAVKKLAFKNRLRWMRERLIERGSRVARKHGWPNIYCMTKSLGESLIAREAGDVAVAIVRPSIVETSTRQPFPGWNEGVNTSAPLSHLLGTYFRQLPTNKRKYLDLIPVDAVCRGMTLISAALVRRQNQSVYHLSTSGGNPCNMQRCIELTGLAHRKYYLAENDARHRWRTRFDSIPVSKLRYQALSAPGQRFFLRGIRRVIGSAPLNKEPLARVNRVDRGLVKLEKLIKLYEPFILYNEPVFEAENIRLIAMGLPAEERESFGWDVESIDWWDYWINIHVPALRHWVFPLIEGRPPEPRQVRPFTLVPAGCASSPSSGAESEISSGGNPASCPSS